MSDKLIVFNDENTKDEFLFTDSRICGLAQLLWFFDKHNSNVVKTYKGKTYNYNECVLKNNDISLLVFNEDMKKYKEQNKYSLLILLYILNKTPTLYKYGKYSFDICRKDIIDKFRITSHNFTEENYIDGLMRLLHINVTYDYQKGDKNMRKIGHLISNIDYDKEDYNGTITVSLDEWCIHMFENMTYRGNKFLKGYIDYSSFISSKTDRVDCMNLPQKIIELYRANQNKKRNGQIRYANIDYFLDLFDHYSKIQRRDIENTVKRINRAIEPSGIYISFDCDATPSKFKKGSFSIKKIKN